MPFDPLQFGLVLFELTLRLRRKTPSYSASHFISKLKGVTEFSFQITIFVREEQNLVRMEWSECPRQPGATRRVGGRKVTWTVVMVGNRLL